MLAVDKALAAGKAKMTSFYDELNVLKIGEDEVSRFSPTGKSFKNINTPQELEEAERIMVLS